MMYFSSIFPDGNSEWKGYNEYNYAPFTSFYMEVFQTESSLTLTSHKSKVHTITLLRKKDKFYINNSLVDIQPITDRCITLISGNYVDTITRLDSGVITRNMSSTYKKGRISFSIYIPFQE